MKNSSYHDLGYTLPAKANVDSAISIIKDLLREAPEILPIVMEPSAILLFADLRATSPYHDFDEQVSEAQKKKFNNVLRKHNLYRCEEDTAYTKEYTGVFSLFNPKAFEEIPTRYGFLKEAWMTPVDYSSTSKMYEWAFITERMLVDMMESNKLPSEWLRDWWAPHNLRFGMLLGYPGIAIGSMLWAQSRYVAEATEDPLENVLVADAKKYFGAEVSFYVLAEYKNHHSITEICKLWNDTIKQVFDAMPFEELMRNQAFKEAYAKRERQYSNG